MLSYKIAYVQWENTKVWLWVPVQLPDDKNCLSLVIFLFNFNYVFNKFIYSIDYLVHTRDCSENFLNI